MKTLGTRLKDLRRELGLSQEAIGAQGICSTPGWIKIENGQRAASEKLIDKLVRWIVTDKYMRPAQATTLKSELLLLKYLGDTSAYVRSLAADRAKATGFGHFLTVAPVEKTRRGRPVVKKGLPPGKKQLTKATA